MTIGIVLVVSLAARTATGLTATSRSTWRCVSSRASSGSRSSSPPANRSSMTRFWPSMYPSSRSFSGRRFDITGVALRTPGVSTPRRYTFPAGCASPANGQTAAPANEVSRKRRRSMRGWWGRRRSGVNGEDQATAAQPSAHAAQPVYAAKVRSGKFAFPACSATLPSTNPGGLVMRIGIIGAGAIGCVVGGMLTKAGRDVTLIDQWPEHVEAMRRKGIRLSGTCGDHLIPVKALHIHEAQSIGAPFDAVFVAVKSYDTEWATHLAVSYLAAPHGVVVDFQNGINDERVAAIAGRERTLGCVITIGAGLYEPGYALRTDSGSVGFKIGEHDGR